MAFIACRPGLSVAAYPSGKVVVGGVEPEGLDRAREALLDFVDGPLPPAEPIAAPIGSLTPRIGLGLAGIGDFFGPLVITAVFAGPTELRALKDGQMRDYPSSGPIYVLRGEGLVRRAVPRANVRVITVGPRRYNELVAPMDGQKGLIGWAQRRCVDSLLARTAGCEAILSREFGRGREGLMLAGSQALPHYAGRTANQDAAVVAASLLARGIFLRKMRSYSTKYGVRFPRGATKVDGVARLLVAQYGEEVLWDVAKTDFKTFQRLVD